MPPDHLKAYVHCVQAVTKTLENEQWPFVNNTLTATCDFNTPDVGMAIVTERLEMKGYTNIKTKIGPNGWIVAFDV